MHALAAIPFLSGLLLGGALFLGLRVPGFEAPRLAWGAWAGRWLPELKGPRELAAGAALLLGLGLLSPWLAPLGLAAWLLAPGCWRRRLRARERAALQEQMPGLLESLAAGLGSGQSLPQALESARADLPPAAEEVVRGLLAGMRLGEAPEALLLGLARGHRGSPLEGDWRMLAMAVAVQRRSGADLGGILEQLAGTLRERQRLQAQVEALTAQGRLSAWVVGGLAPLLLLALQLLDPGLLAPLFRTPRGWVLLALAALLEAAGILVLRGMLGLKP